MQVLACHYRCSFLYMKMQLHAVHRSAGGSQYRSSFLCMPMQLQKHAVHRNAGNMPLQELFSWPDNNYAITEACYAQYLMQATRHYRNSFLCMTMTMQFQKHAMHSNAGDMPLQELFSLHDHDHAIAEACCALNAGRFYQKICNQTKLWCILSSCKFANFGIYSLKMPGEQILILAKATLQTRSEVKIHLSYCPGLSRLMGHKARKLPHSTVPIVWGLSGEMGLKARKLPHSTIPIVWVYLE